MSNSTLASFLPCCTSHIYSCGNVYEDLDGHRHIHLLVKLAYLFLATYSNSLYENSTCHSSMSLLMGLTAACHCRQRGSDHLYIAPHRIIQCRCGMGDGVLGPWLSHCGSLRDLAQQPIVAALTCVLITGDKASWEGSLESLWPPVCCIPVSTVTRRIHFTYFGSPVLGGHIPELHAALVGGAMH